MARARLLKAIIRKGSGLPADGSCRVYEPGTTTDIAQSIYAADTGATTRANPFTFTGGVIDFYLVTPQRVKLVVTPSGGSAQTFDNLDVLLPAGVKPDADTLDGVDSTGFVTVGALTTALAGKLGTSAKAADSELLDGIDSANFARRDAANTFTAGATFGGTVNVGTGQLQEGGHRVYTSGGLEPETGMKVLGGIIQASVPGGSAVASICTFVAPLAGKVKVDLTCPQSVSVYASLDGSAPLVSNGATFTSLYYTGLTPGATYAVYAGTSAGGAQLVNVVVLG